MVDKQLKSCTVGIDTGGTFTDFVWYCDGNLSAFKLLSTPDDPARAILQGLRQLKSLGYQVEAIVHGTTVATNALLERKGVPTAYITNQGLEDTLLIGRQARADIYALAPLPQRSVVVREHCLGVAARMDATGRVLTDLQADDLDGLLQQLEQLDVNAVAVCLLFAYKNSIHEERLANVLRDRWFCSISSQVVAEVREYERGMATWLNSYLGPVIKAYLVSLAQQSHVKPIRVMQSSGLTLPLEQASDNSVRLLLSGPAGGYIAAQQVSRQCTEKKCITLDMGGTSTDVALISEVEQISTAHQVAGYPVAVPALDIHTIGAGGGSIAWLDEGGVLRLGPKSAGADPGPAAYSRGGTEVTVTDANVLLGRIPVEFAQSSGFRLSLADAQKAFIRLAERIGQEPLEIADGVVRMANQHMLEALRVISVLKGHDPGSCALLCFGGAGALHICELASALGVRHVIYPHSAGQLSALGMLMADQGEEASRSIGKPLLQCDHDEVECLIEQLAAPIEKRLSTAKSAVTTQHARLDLRYQGQSTTLTVPWQGIPECVRAFEKCYQRLYGHHFTEVAVELATVRVKVSQSAVLQAIPRWSGRGRASPVGDAQDYLNGVSTKVYRRCDLGYKQALRGPCIVLDEGSTLYINNRWQGQVDQWGHIQLNSI